MTLPSQAHEQPITQINFAFQTAITSIGHDNALVQVHAHANSRFSGDSIHADPDIHIICTPFVDIGVPNKSISLWILENCLSQTESAGRDKIRRIIADESGILLASLINMIEAHRYANPDPGSEIAQRLRSKPVMSFEEWTPTRTRSNQFGPVISEGHSWVELSKIEFHTWIRAEDSAIDLENDDPSVYSKGVSDDLFTFSPCLSTHLQSLFPIENTSDMDAMIGRGIAKIRDVILHHLVLLDPEGDHDDVRQWTPPAKVIRWKEIKASLVTAVWATAYNRYKLWHRSLLKRKAEGADDRSTKKARV